MKWSPADEEHHHHRDWPFIWVIFIFIFVFSFIQKVAVRILGLVIQGLL